MQLCKVTSCALNISSKSEGIFILKTSHSVGCHSRHCPIHQYNKDKSQKFYVDFFICADSNVYLILHLDVYKVKNANNVGFHDSLTTLPSMQKAIANSLHSPGLHLTCDGMRHISMMSDSETLHCWMICWWVGWYARLS